MAGERDWDACRASKEAYWRSLSASERLRLADDLRRAALALHPDWPTDAMRAADVASHERVCERLERASRKLKR